MLKRNSVYEKFKRNLGEQQNIPEILGSIRVFYDSSLFLEYFRALRRLGNPEIYGRRASVKY